MPDDSPVSIEFRPSRIFAGGLVGAHGLALLAAWVSLSGWVHMLVAFGVCLSALGCLAEALQWSGRAAVALELRADGRARWRDRKGLWHESLLGNDHFLSPVLMVVGLLTGGRSRKRIVLFSDSAAPEELRRLRVRLQWHIRGEPGTGAGAADPQ